MHNYRQHEPKVTGAQQREAVPRVTNLLPGDLALALPGERPQGSICCWWPFLATLAHLPWFLKDLLWGHMEKKRLCQDTNSVTLGPIKTTLSLKRKHQIPETPNAQQN